MLSKKKMQILKAVPSLEKVESPNE